MYRIETDVMYMGDEAFIVAIDISEVEEKNPNDVQSGEKVGYDTFREIEYRHSKAGIYKILLSMIKENLFDGFEFDETTQYTKDFIDTLISYDRQRLMEEYPEALL